jgi:hypothetical protein
MLLISTNRTQKDTTYDVGNLGPGLGQVHKCGGLNRLMGFQPSNHEPLQRHSMYKHKR